MEGCRGHARILDSAYLKTRFVENSSMTPSVFPEHDPVGFPRHLQFAGASREADLDAKKANPSTAVDG